MKYLISSIVLLCSVLSVTAKDLITLRNGLEKEVYVVQVGNDKIVYKESKGKKATEQFLNLEDVYMIFYGKRGIVYITQDGKRVSEDVESLKKIAKASTWVYLVKGKVYPAYDIKISENEIEFKILRGKDFSSMIFNKSDVFMIKYSDGTRDIITEFKPKEEPKPIVKEPEIKQEQEEPVEDVQQVIFHNVKSGDTLAKLAKRYNVTVENIKEWNELPAKLKSTARLQTDMQLMLYVDIINTEN